MRNRFASFFHQPRRHPSSAIALIKMIKSILHPPNNFRIGDKNQWIVFTNGIAIWYFSGLVRINLLAQNQPGNQLPSYSHLSSPQIMYHFLIEFLELAVSCLGLGEGGCDCTALAMH
mgnify:CR=1 FL=1